MCELYVLVHSLGNIVLMVASVCNSWKSKWCKSDLCYIFILIWIILVIYRSFMCIFIYKCESLQIKCNEIYTTVHKHFFIYLLLIISLNLYLFIFIFRVIEFSRHVWRWYIEFEKDFKERNKYWLELPLRKTWRTLMYFYDNKTHVTNRKKKKSFLHFKPNPTKIIIYFSSKI